MTPKLEEDAKLATVFDWVTIILVVTYFTYRLITMDTAG